MSTAVAKVSLEEFLAMPGATFHDFHELHNGEVVEVPNPTLGHFLLQEWLVQLLAKLCAAAGYRSAREFYYTLEGEARRADVVMLRTERLRWPLSKVFSGAPELVVEILSPSNPAMDVDHIREVCLGAGSIEFWELNMEFQTITVFGRGHSVRIYVPGDELSLEAFGISAALPVVEIFRSEL